MFIVPKLRVTWIALVLAIGIGSVTGAETDAQNCVVDGALESSVWYDAEQSRVVPVHVDPVVDDTANRDSRWLPKPKRVKQAPAPATGGGGTGGGSGIFGSGLTIRNLFGWMLLIALIALAIGMLIYLLGKTEIDLATGSKSASGALSGSPDEQTIERMKHLPAELRRTDVNLRSEAERLMNEGQFDQAIILMFGHQLLLLDHVGMLRLNRGKTNRKYVRETRAADRSSAKCLLATVTAFERSYFGRHLITKSEFTELWRANADLEQAIERRQEVAA